MNKMKYWEQPPVAMVSWTWSLKPSLQLAPRTRTKGMLGAH